MDALLTTSWATAQTLSPIKPASDTHPHPLVSYESLLRCESCFEFNQEGIQELLILW